MSNNPLVSIIVPVYNVERYLPRCIESILRQTYTNFELILVDDGTPDRSGIICDKYAEKDSRIKVIHKENGGVSTARNAGIDAAQGEWITFIDSDDWVSYDYLEHLTNPLNNYEHDLIVGKKQTRSMCIDGEESLPIHITKEKCSNLEFLKIFDFIEFMGPWMKLFSKSIIDTNNLRFISGIAMAEDAIFVAMYLKYCKSIFMTGKVIYYYNRLNELSVTKKIPYFEDRKNWDIKYLTEYLEMLNSFRVSEQLRKDIMARKAMLGFRTVARAIICNFDEADAKKKIEELFPCYSLWLDRDLLWIDSVTEDTQKQLAEAINRFDVDAIYELLKNKKQALIITKIKQVIKKMIRPSIEKYRDGLIKFKF